MKTVNIHDAKTNLSKLLKAVDQGEKLIIAKAGTPMYEVSLIRKKPIQRIGFLEGKANVPEDFNTMMREEIEEMFYDWPLTSVDEPAKR